MKLIVGQNASFSKTITESDVYNFAGLVGDFNDVHINQVAAEKSMFGKRIAHGMLVGSFISTVLGMYLPGPGTIYLEQNLKFRRPVFFNDTITATVTVKECLNMEKGIFSLETNIKNQDENIVIEGTAIVKYLGGVENEND